jgi:RNA polymerase sigma factor (sigma-70 family)
MSGAKAIGRTAAAPAPFHRLLSDERLARRSARGDTAAFGVLFERHHQTIYRYCRSIVGDGEEAADALQSTMEKALGAIARRDSEAPLRAWLFRIAHNESVNQLRRRRGAATTPLEDEALLAPDVAATAEQRERLAQLVRDLRELPDRQRGALLMREVSGLSHEEIAAAFGVSTGAVKQSIHEARSALHEQARGREMTCDAVCRTLGDGDGRTARQRRIRAHLRGCADCRAFSEGLKARRADLAVLTPMLPGPAAAAVLAAVTGVGTGGGGGLLAGLLGGGGASSALAKGAAVGAVTVTAGAGAVTFTDLRGAGDRPADGRAPAAAKPDKPARAVAAEPAGGGPATLRLIAAPEDEGAVPAAGRERDDERRSGARRGGGGPGEDEDGEREERRERGNAGDGGDEDRDDRERDDDDDARRERDRDRDEDEDAREAVEDDEREAEDDDEEREDRSGSSGSGQGGSAESAGEDESGRGGGKEEEDELPDPDGETVSGAEPPVSVPDPGGVEPEDDPD